MNCECGKSPVACERHQSDSEEFTCGDCLFFTGEECDGQNEGDEVYEDDRACGGFELKGEKNEST